MRPARIRGYTGDITDIDSIIEINGREIATTLESRGDLSTGQRRHRRRHREGLREYEYGAPWALPKRVNGSDLLSFFGRENRD